MFTSGFWSVVQRLDMQQSTAEQSRVREVSEEGRRPKGEQ